MENLNNPGINGKTFKLDLSTGEEWILGEDWEFNSNPIKQPNGDYFYTIKVLSQRMEDYLKTIKPIEENEQSISTDSSR